MEFRPTLTYQILESVVVGILIGGVMMLVFLDGSGWVMSAKIGFGFGLLVAFLYIFRYFYRGARRVQVDPDSLTIDTPIQKTTLLWKDVRAACHENKNGLRWRFATGKEAVVLRDDGFRTGQWEEITLAITACLERHQIEIGRDGYGELFNDSHGS